MMVNKQRILLTGGSGFIGRNLLESPLAQKYEMLAPRHSELDLLDEKSVADYFGKYAPDYVIHSACKPGHRNAKDPSSLFYTNTRMFFNLAANSARYKKMLVLGSGAIYDMRYYQPKMREDFFGAHVPLDEHGFSKYVCGKYAERADNIVDLRVFGVFGKYEDYAIRFISNMICKAIFDLPLTMNQNRKFDYIWVQDLAPVLDHFLSVEVPRKAYNITPNASIELLDLARKVLSIAGKNLPIKVAQQGMGLEYSGDNSLLRQEMPGFSFTPAETAIKALYEWYSARKDSLNKEFLLSDK